MWVGVALTVVGVWAALSIGLALFLGRMIGIADKRRRDQVWFRRMLRSNRRSRARARSGSVATSDPGAEEDSDRGSEVDHAG